MLVRRLVACAVVVLLVGACNSDAPTATTTTTSTSTSTSTSSTTTTSTSAPADECPANTDPQSDGARQPRAELTALRAAHQPGFDRVVFEFDGTSPGFRVSYVKRPVTEDASGEEVTVRGRYVLEVRMENASGYHLAGDDSHETYTGPGRIRPGDTRVVEEIVRTGDFEGILTWVVGLRERNGFRVRRLTDPHRLMVEICAAD